ncbi:hypothetical protein [Verrucomicrobium sp. BvORR034]|uniref:hypothetical protein n=1 Tax=Verrucomicrobium sp. BvORR034 TaxID=1396418 RepID=UPI00224101E6|nr:hypothetical protein [Verrucomicrobium sp. BvORR034]
MTRLNSFRRPWCFALVASLFPASPFLVTGVSAEEALVTPATRVELWVPTKHLEEVLKKHPNAVMLDAKQYEALIRDAGKVKPIESAEPPVTTAVEDARVEVTVPPEGPTVQVEYRYVLNNLGKGWCEVELPLPVRDGASMKLVDVKSQRPVMIHAGEESVRVLTEGEGRHELKFVFAMVTSPQPGFDLTYPVAALATASSTVVKLNLPAGWQPVDYRGEVVKAGIRAVENAGRYSVPSANFNDALKSKLRVFTVGWKRSDATRRDGRETAVRGRMICKLTPDKLVGVTMLTYALLPEMEGGRLHIQVPAGVQVLGVRSDVGQHRWKLEGNRLEVEEVGLPGSVRSLVIGFEQPLVLPLSGSMQATLPVFKDERGSLFDGWSCVLLASSGVDVRFDELLRSSSPPGQEVSDGTWPAVLRESAEVFGLDAKAATALHHDIRKHPEFVAAMDFDAPPAKTGITVTRAPDRFSVDQDTSVILSAHEAAIARTLTLHGEAGTTERASVTLPAGETFLGAQSTGAAPLEWKQVGQALELFWPRGLAAGTDAIFVVRTRKEIGTAAAEGAGTEAFALSGLQVPGSARTTGYVALAFDESWKVNVTATTGLEARDIRLSPVKGRMAWYCLKDWQLQFEISRRAPVHDVAVTAYALPRARQVEIEGQLELLVNGAPLRKFDVKLDPKLAPLFRVTSLLVAEQVLDDATGVWHFTLRKEVLGTESVRFRMSLPATDGDSQSLRSALPDIGTPGARRRTTAWVVEANTDTEIEFETKGVQPLDSLRPPAVSGYQPRHRVIAAFSSTGGEHSIQITARRHKPAALAGALVLQARMVSIIGQNGPVRHEVTYTLRHNGRQFLSLALPKGAVLLSTLVQDRPVKPVQAGGVDQLRVPLPVLNSEADFVSAKVVYETAPITWGSWGKTPLEPPAVLEGVPVLSSQWKVHVPDGYALHHSGGGLEAGEEPVDAPKSLLATLWDELPLPYWSSGVKHVESASIEFMPGGGSLAKEGQGDWWIESQRPENAAAIQALTMKLEQIILPKVHFAGASLEAAMGELDRMATESDPAKKGVRMVVQSATVPSTAQISLDLTDVPLSEALRYVTELAGFKYVIKTDHVEIVPLSDVGTEQYTRRFKVPLRHYLEWQSQMTGHKSELPPKGLVSVVDLLKAQGIQFPEGANAAYDAESEALVARNTQPNLDQVGAFVESIQRVDRIADDLRMQEFAEMPQNGEGADASRYFTNKLDRIIIPRVQFQGASIEEALEFLRIKSRDFDTVERDPSRKGINLIAKHGSTPSTAQISLDLKDVPMSEALRYVTELAGMKYKIEPFAVVVVPLSDAGTEMYTRTFKVPHDFLRLDADGTGPVDPFANPNLESSTLKRKATSLNVLSSQGINLPEGASAVYVAATNQLIVRNTQANLDQVEAFVDSMNAAALKRLRAKLAKSSKAGILPVELELPTAGQVMEFSGNQKAEPLFIHYVSWDWQLFRTSLLVILGALAFRLIGRDRPWMSTLFVCLLLTFVPPLLFPNLLPSCNALLLGWLLGFVLRLLWKFLLWCTPVPSSRQIRGKEFAV